MGTPSLPCYVPDYTETPSTEKAPPPAQKKYECAGCGAKLFDLDGACAYCKTKS